MQFVINDELSCGPRLAVDRLNRILDLGGERVQELDAAGEEPSFLIDTAQARWPGPWRSSVCAVRARQNRCSLILCPRITIRATKAA